MKPTKTYRAQGNNYRVIDELPADAMTIREYCEKRECTNPYIYQLARDGKANFEIVIFKGINFVINVKEILT